jgi:Domain of unknown function (DUF4411)
MAYLLDANVFIEAKRRHYGMDFCPAFSDWLADANSDGRVFSIEKVVTSWQQAPMSWLPGLRVEVPGFSCLRTRRCSTALLR